MNQTAINALLDETHYIIEAWQVNIRQSRYGRYSPRLAGHDENTHAG